MATKIFTAEDVRQMRVMYEEEGRDSSEIARIMTCYPTTVRKYLRDAGVRLRPRGGGKVLKGVSHREMELIKFLYWNCEWTIGMIAEHIGASPFAIRYRMDKAGIPRRDRTQQMKVGYKRGRIVNPRRQQENVAA